MSSHRVYGPPMPPDADDMTSAVSNSSGTPSSSGSKKQEYWTSTYKDAAEELGKIAAMHRERYVKLGRIRGTGPSAQAIDLSESPFPNPTIQKPRPPPASTSI